VGVVLLIKVTILLFEDVLPGFSEIVEKLFLYQPLFFHLIAKVATDPK
jgi:hypothetical protein